PGYRAGRRTGGYLGSVASMQVSDASSSHSTHRLDSTPTPGTGVAGRYPGRLTCADTPTARPRTVTAVTGTSVGRPALASFLRSWAGEAFDPTASTGVSDVIGKL